MVRLQGNTKAISILGKFHLILSVALIRRLPKKITSQKRNSLRSADQRGLRYYILKINSPDALILVEKNGSGSKIFDLE